MDQPVNDKKFDAWQASMHQPKFMAFDAKIVIGPIFYATFGITSWPMFLFALIWVAYFIAIGIFEMSPAASLRRLRSAAFGGIRPNYPVNKARNRFLGEEA